MSELSKSDEVIDLHQSFFGGIRKVMYYCGITKETFITVEDNNGPNFSVDVPSEIPEGRNPMWYFDHAMLFSPDDISARQIYAPTDTSLGEEAHHVRGSE